MSLAMLHRPGKSQYKHSWCTISLISGHVTWCSILMWYLKDKKLITWNLVKARPAFITNIKANIFWIFGSFSFQQWWSTVAITPWWSTTWIDRTDDTKACGVRFSKIQACDDFVSRASQSSSLFPLMAAGELIERLDNQISVPSQKHLSGFFCLGGRQ